MDIIVVHGCPGSGKTTVAKRLHEALKSPWFEFGWIPEFRMLNPYTEISYETEEQIAFENLVLVSRNYVKHGFENILLSDLSDKRVSSISDCFDANSYSIFTLFLENDAIIKQRIENRNDGNGYKNFQQAIEINSAICKRSILPNEYRIRSDNQSIDSIIKQILNILAK